MKDNEKIEIIKQFNDCINNSDITKLAELMTENHTFIDRVNTRVEGKQIMIEGWQAFFKSFPDYRNHFENLIVRDDFIVITGYATCSEPLLDGKFLWSAKIENGLVAEWKVYDDNPHNRKKLNLVNI